MREVLTWVFISGLLFISFLTSLIWWLVKKQKKLSIISFIMLLLLCGSASWTVYLFASKSYNKAVILLKPRTGEEIYAALFGETDNECLRVLHHQDQIVPKIDYAIWLHFETCPDELNRILQLHNFNSERKSTQGLRTDGPLANDNWFKPEILGDTVLVFIYQKDNYGNGQTIYASLDSTEAFCIDVLD